jgi:hypothetical protein
VTSFDAWLAEGVENGYLFGVCLMHDSPPFTAPEELEADQGFDPCQPRYLVKPELLE